jgi:DNA (cytosine-5)-methyltransferase 1
VQAKLSLEKDSKPLDQPSFIDLFAGCGGLSLGLMQAGWQGLFAIEKDKYAFETLRTNLIDTESSLKFCWPNWLPKSPISVESFITEFGAHIEESIDLDLLVGGPPCQGFSDAGKRNPNDPRNQLLKDYLRFVDLLKPKIVLIENVRGFTHDFTNENDPSGKINFSTLLISALSKNYNVKTSLIDVSDFGVPQHRTRYFVIGVRNDLFTLMPTINPLDTLVKNRFGFLRKKQLVTPVSSRSAISDLEIQKNGTVPCPECPGFLAISYVSPRTRFQTLMRENSFRAPEDTRIARHNPDIIDRFTKIIHHCKGKGRLNISLGKETRDLFGLKKQALRVLDPDRAAPTITSMPDDLLHYSEPRTLTVRENARLQSFPDWFVFRGKYTSGGHMRRHEVPRFTQVANAVPPLMAEAIGQVLLECMLTFYQEFAPVESLNCESTETFDAAQ